MTNHCVNAYSVYDISIDSVADKNKCKAQLLFPKTSQFDLQNNIWYRNNRTLEHESNTASFITERHLRDHLPNLHC